MAAMPLWLSTTLLGFGTVFVGLVCLIFIIKLMSFLLGLFSKKPAPETAAPVAVGVQEPIADRQQFVAAVSAVLATVMGADVSGLRITSIKKVK